jgi:hypothetical protein
MKPQAKKIYLKFNFFCFGDFIIFKQITVCLYQPTTRVLALHISTPVVKLCIDNKKNKLIKT